jgi:hypothetical protein
MDGLPKFIIARADGDSFDGEFSFFTVDGPDDWHPAEAYDLDDPTEYVILRVDPEPVGRRTFGLPNVDDA